MSGKYAKLLIFWGVYLCIVPLLHLHWTLVRHFSLRSEGSEQMDRIIPTVAPEEPG